MKKRTGMTKKIRECAEVILYWKKNPDKFGAESSRKVFEKALHAHLEYVKEKGEEIHPDVMKMAERALA